MTERANGEVSMEEPTSPSEDSGFAPCGRIESHPRASTDDPFRPRWMDIADPRERQCAHIVDMLGFCGHYMHVNGGGRSGPRAGRPRAARPRAVPRRSPHLP